MGRFIVPLKRPQPNIEKWVKVMKGELVPERPPMVEYTIDSAVMKPILTEMMGHRWITTSDHLPEGLGLITCHAGVYWNMYADS